MPNHHRIPATPTPAIPRRSQPYALTDMLTVGSFRWTRLTRASITANARPSVNHSGRSTQPVPRTKGAIMSDGTYPPRYRTHSPASDGRSALAGSHGAGATARAAAISSDPSPASRLTMPMPVK